MSQNRWPREEDKIDLDAAEEALRSPQAGVETQEGDIDLDEVPPLPPSPRPLPDANEGQVGRMVSEAGGGDGGHGGRGAGEEERGQVQRLLQKLQEERAGRGKLEEENATLKAQVKRLKSQLSREKAKGEADSRRAKDEVEAAQAQVEGERKMRETLKGRAEAYVREARAQVALQLGEVQQERVKAQRETETMRAEIKRVQEQAKRDADRAWREMEKLRGRQQHEALAQDAEREAAAKAKSALRAQIKEERDDTELERAEQENKALRDKLMVVQSQAERLRQQVKLARQQAPTDESPPPQEPPEVQPAPPQDGGDAAPVTVSLSRQNIAFTFPQDSVEPTVSENVVITNTGSSPVGFRIEDQSPNFTASPASGTVHASGSEEVVVTFNPGQKPRHEHQMKVTVVGGGAMTLTLAGEVDKGAIRATSKPVDFSTIAVGSSKSKNITLANTAKEDTGRARAPAAFYLDLAEMRQKYPWLSSVTPDKGLLKAGETRQLVATVCSERALNIDEHITVSVRGGKPVKINVKADIQIPVVELRTDELDFGSAHLGAMVSKTLIIANLSAIPAIFTLDLRKYPEFTVVVPDDLDFDDDEKPQQGKSPPLNEGSKDNDLVGEPEGARVRFRVTPNAEGRIEMTYQPAALAQHVFELPLSLQGMPSGSVKALQRTVVAKAIKPRMLMSSAAVDFGKRVAVSADMKGFTYTQDVTLTNCDDKPMTVDCKMEGHSVDQGGARDTHDRGVVGHELAALRKPLERILRLEQAVNSQPLQASESMTLLIHFVPPSDAEYRAKLVICLDGDTDRPYLTIQVKGSGGLPNPGGPANEAVEHVEKQVEKKPEREKKQRVPIPRHIKRPPKDEDTRLGPLFFASLEGDLASVEAFLSEGVVPERFDTFGKTPLQAAALQGHVEVVGALLPKSDTEVQDCNAMTCAVSVALQLHRSHRARDHRRKRGTEDPNAVNASDVGMTEIAPDSPECSRLEKILLMLLQAGADFTNLRDKDILGDGTNAYASEPQVSALEVTRRVLDTWVSPWDASAGVQAAPPMARVMAIRECWGDKFHVDVNEPDMATGRTYLHYAAASGQAGVCKELLEAGSDPTARDYSGKNALHCACEHAHDDVVAVLLGSGDLVGCADVCLRLPLHCWDFSRAREEVGAGFQELVVSTGKLEGGGKVTDLTGRSVLHVAAAAASASEMLCMMRNIPSLDCNTLEGDALAPRCIGAVRLTSDDESLPACAPFDVSGEGWKVLGKWDECCRGLMQRVSKRFESRWKRRGEKCVIRARRHLELKHDVFNARTAFHLSVASGNVGAVEVLLDSYGDGVEFSGPLVSSVFASTATFPDKLYALAWSAAKSANLWPSVPSRSLVDAVCNDGALQIRLQVVRDNLNSHSVLGLCMLCGDSELAKVCIEKGADTTSAEASCELMMLACSIGSLEIVQLLLDSGASVDARTQIDLEGGLGKCGEEDYDNLLQKEWEAVKQREDAFLNLVSWAGQAPYDRSTKIPFTEEKHSFLDYNVCEMPGKQIDIEKLKVFRQYAESRFVLKGRDTGTPAAQDSTWLSCLSKAIAEGHYKVAALLVERGANVSEVIGFEANLQRAPVSALSLVILQAADTRKDRSRRHTDHMLQLSGLERLFPARDALGETIARKVQLSAGTTDFLLSDAIKAGMTSTALALIEGNSTSVLDGLCDQHGVPVLITAATAGYVALLDALLSKGVDARVVDGKGRSLLEVCLCTLNFDCAGVVCKWAWERERRGLKTRDVARSLLLLWAVGDPQQQENVNVMFARAWASGRKPGGDGEGKDADGAKLPPFQGLTAEEVLELNEVHSGIRDLANVTKKASGYSLKKASLCLKNRAQYTALEECVDDCFEEKCGTEALWRSGEACAGREKVRTMVLVSVEWFLVGKEAIAESPGSSAVLFSVCNMKRKRPVGLSPPQKRGLCDEGDQRVSAYHSFVENEWRARLEVAQLLLQAGASPDTRCEGTSTLDLFLMGPSWVSCLGAALYNGEADMVELLIEKGADMSQVVGFPADSGREPLSAISLILHLAENGVPKPKSEADWHPTSRAFHVLREVGAEESESGAGDEESEDAKEEVEEEKGEGDQGEELQEEEAEEAVEEGKGEEQQEEEAAGTKVDYLRDSGPIPLEVADAIGAMIASKLEITTPSGAEWVLNALTKGLTSTAVCLVQATSTSVLDTYRNAEGQPLLLLAAKAENSKVVDALLGKGVNAKVRGQNRYWNGGNTVLEECLSKVCISTASCDCVAVICKRLWSSKWRGMSIREMTRLLLLSHSLGKGQAFSELHIILMKSWGLRKPVQSQADTVGVPSASQAELFMKLAPKEADELARIAIAMYALLDVGMVERWKGMDEFAADVGAKCTHHTRNAMALACANWYLRDTPEEIASEPHFHWMVAGGLGDDGLARHALETKMSPNVKIALKSQHGGVEAGLHAAVHQAICGLVPWPHTASPLSVALACKRYAIAGLLVDGGADCTTGVTTTDGKNVSDLVVALRGMPKCTSTETEAESLLLKMVAVRGTFCGESLLLAVKKGYSLLTVKLLEADADSARAFLAAGASAVLRTAVCTGDVVAVQALLKHGADMHCKVEGRGSEVLEQSLLLTGNPVASVLCGEDITDNAQALVASALSGDENRFMARWKKLSVDDQKTAASEARSSWGHTLLMCAVRGSCLDIVNALLALETAAKLILEASHVTFGKFSKLTDALALSVELGRERIACELLAILKGFPNNPGHEWLGGRTLMQLAIRSCSASLVRVLAAHSGCAGKDDPSSSPSLIQELIRADAATLHALLCVRDGVSKEQDSSLILLEYTKFEEGLSKASPVSRVAFNRILTRFVLSSFERTSSPEHQSFLDACGCWGELWGENAVSDKKSRKRRKAARAAGKGRAAHAMEGGKSKDSWEGSHFATIFGQDEDSTLKSLVEAAVSHVGYEQVYLHCTTESAARSLLKSTKASAAQVSRLVWLSFKHKMQKGYVMLQYLIDTFGTSELAVDSDGVGVDDCQPVALTCVSQIAFLTAVMNGCVQSAELLLQKCHAEWKDEQAGLRVLLETINVLGRRSKVVLQWKSLLPCYGLDLVIGREEPVATWGTDKWWHPSLDRVWGALDTHPRLLRDGSDPSPLVREIDIEAAKDLLPAKGSEGTADERPLDVFLNEVIHYAGRTLTFSEDLHESDWQSIISVGEDDIEASQKEGSAEQSDLRYVSEYKGVYVALALPEIQWGIVRNFVFASLPGWLTDFPDFSKAMCRHSQERFPAKKYREQAKEGFPWPSMLDFAARKDSIEMKVGESVLQTVGAADELFRIIWEGTFRQKFCLNPMDVSQVSGIPDDQYLATLYRLTYTPFAVEGIVGKGLGVKRFQQSRPTSAFLNMDGQDGEWMLLRDPPNRIAAAPGEETEVVSIDMTGSLATQAALARVQASSVRRLSMAQMNVGPGDLQALEGVFSEFLRYLDLDHNFLGNQGLKTVLGLVAKCQSLQFLSIAYNGITDASPLAAVLQDLPDSHALRHVGLCGNPLGDTIRELANAVASAIARGCALESCTVGVSTSSIDAAQPPEPEWWEVRPPSRLATAKSAKRSEKAASRPQTSAGVAQAEEGGNATFSFGQNDFFLVPVSEVVSHGIAGKTRAWRNAEAWAGTGPSGVDLAFLCHVMSSPAALRKCGKVEITELPLEDECVGILCQSLQRNGAPQHLGLVSVGMLGPGAASVSGMLKIIGGTLVSLDLGGNMIGDDSVAKLCEEMIQMTVLEVLGLGMVGMTDVGLSHLVKPLGTMTALKRLNIGRNDFSCSNYQCELRRFGETVSGALPRCEVTVDNPHKVEQFACGQDLKLSPMPVGTDSRYTLMDCAFMSGLLAASTSLQTLRIWGCSTSCMLDEELHASSQNLEALWSHWHTESKDHPEAHLVDVPVQPYRYIDTGAIFDWEVLAEDCASILLSGLSECTSISRVAFADNTRAVCLCRLTPNAGAVTLEHAPTPGTATLPPRNSLVKSMLIVHTMLLKCDKEAERLLVGAHRHQASLDFSQTITLNLSDCNLSFAARELSRTIRTLSGALIKLDISNNKFTRDQRQMLAKSIRLCRQMTHLTLSEPTFSAFESECPEYAMAVAELSQLKCLNTWYAGDEDFLCDDTPAGLAKPKMESGEEKEEQKVKEEEEEEHTIHPYMYLFFARCLESAGQEQRSKLQDGNILNGKDSFRTLDLSGSGLSVLPAEVRHLLHIRHIDVSDNNLDRLPVDSLCEMASHGELKGIECRGNPRLVSPPPEITGQNEYSEGSKSDTEERSARSLEFLMQIKDTGVPNHEMLMVVIGDGEAGKTSVIKALMSDRDVSGAIDADNRTVGIDILQWTPNVDSEINFSILDLAGQKVYALTHQFFLVRRGVYILVWRAYADPTEQKQQELEKMVLHWCDSLQLRVPGATLMLAVTHIDLVKDPEKLDAQVEKVRSVIQRKLSEQRATQGVRILPLRVLNGGLSIRVNCIKGHGMTELREAVLKATFELPWYGELIPESYQKLRSAIVKRSSEPGAGYLSWDEYTAIAKECQLDEDKMMVATKFLHDTGILKHFDDLEEYRDRVFINANWIIDALKGLIRHDRQILHDWFNQLKDKSETRSWTRKVLRLTTYGLLHKDIIPYLWPAAESTKDFWESARKDEKEGTLWTTDVATTQDAYDSVIKLLRGCEILEQVSEDEYIVPGLLSSASQPKLDARSLSSHDCPYKKTFIYHTLPPGFFDRMLTTCRRSATRMDFTSNDAVIYWRGYKSQIFLTTEEKKELLHDEVSDEIDEDGDEGESGAKTVTRNVVKITVLFSFTSHLAKIEGAIRKLERFFPGMQRLDTGEKDAFPEVDPAQVHILTSHDCHETREMASNYLSTRVKEVDSEQQRRSFGLELAVSSTLTRVECLELHVAAVARGAMRWIAHALESVNLTREYIASSGDSSAGLRQSSTVADVVSRWFFAPGEVDGDHYQTPFGKDFDTKYAHGRLLRWTEYAGDLEKLCQYLQNLPQQVGMELNPALENDISTPALIRKWMPQTHKDCADCQHMLEAAVGRIADFVAMGSASRTHMPLWQEGLFEQVQLLLEYRDAVEGAFNACEAVHSDAENFVNHNKEMQSWSAKPQKAEPTGSRPQTSSKKQEISGSRPPTSSKIEGDSGSRPPTSSRLSSAKPKSRPPSARPGKAKDQETEADSISRPGTGKQPKEGAVQKEPRVLKEFKRLTEEASVVMSEVDRLVALWQKSGKEDFGFPVFEQSKMLEFLSQSTKYAQESLKAVDVKTQALLDVYSQEQQETISRIRELVRQNELPDLLKLMEPDNVSAKRSELKKKDGFVQVFERIATQYVTKLEREYTKRRRLELGINSPKLSSVTNREESVGGRYSRIAEVAVVTSTKELTSMIERCRAVISGRKGSRESIQRFVELDENRTERLESDLRNLHLFAYNSIADPLEKHSKDDDSQFKDVSKKALDIGLAVKIESLPWRAISENALKVVKNLEKSQTHYSGVLTTERDTLSSAYNFWDRFAADGLVHLSVVAAVWYKIPNLSEDEKRNMASVANLQPGHSDRAALENRVQVAILAIAERFAGSWNPGQRPPLPPSQEKNNDLSKHISDEWLLYCFSFASFSFKVQEAVAISAKVADIRELVRDNQGASDWFEPLFESLEHDSVLRFISDLRKMQRGMTKRLTLLTDVFQAKTDQPGSTPYDALKRDFDIRELKSSDIALVDKVKELETAGHVIKAQTVTTVHGSARAVWAVIGDLCNLAAERIGDLATFDAIQAALIKAKHFVREALDVQESVIGHNDFTQQGVDGLGTRVTSVLYQEGEGGLEAEGIAKNITGCWQARVSEWDSRKIRADRLWRARFETTINPDIRESSFDSFALAGERGSFIAVLDGNQYHLQNALVEAKRRLSELSGNVQSDADSEEVARRRHALKAMEDAWGNEIALQKKITLLRESLKTHKSDEMQHPEDGAGAGEVVSVDNKEMDVVVADDKRVILVCIDPCIGYDGYTLSELKRHIRRKRAIIPLIMPQYMPVVIERKFQEWWPDSMKELEEHALFVDCSEKGKIENQVRTQILPQVTKFLEEWQGDATDMAEIQHTQREKVQCIECLSRGIDPPHEFQRSECLEKQEMWRKKELEKRSSSQASMDMHVPEPFIECANGHQSKVRDVLSRSVVYDAVMCPLCKQAGDLPPFAFNRQNLLLYFGDNDKNRVGAADCKKCASKNRPSSIRILDLIVPEIFVSYNWGVRVPDGQSSTQIHAKKLAKSIEETHELVCWLDVHGGMGAGQDHIKEMSEGIAKCTVVVMLLSDAYLESDNCLRELYHTINQSKYIVPVLVPNADEFDEGLEARQKKEIEEKNKKAEREEDKKRYVSPGWTGGAGRDWWQHCKNSSKKTFPDPPHQQIEWSILKHFKPIDFRNRSKEARDQAEIEISERISSRFHRGDYINHETAKSYQSWQRAKERIVRELGEDWGTVERDELDRRIRALFDKIDTDGGGSIDRSELENAMRNILCVDVSERELENMIMHADEDDDGEIQFQEFLDMTRGLLQI